MNIEVMIYIYMIVCTAMILFNCVTVVVNGRRSQRLEKSDNRIGSRILVQLQRLESGKPVEDEHIQWMMQKLQRLENLRIFDADMERLRKSDGAAAEAYLDRVCEVFPKLTERYCRKDTMKAAYFAYVVRKYHIVRRSRFDSLTETMLRLVSFSSVYARENALHCIYDMGDTGYVIRALRILDRGRSFHHPKLIHDGLLEFTGEREELLSAIWSGFGQFSNEMQTTLLNYMRLSGGGCDDKVFALMSEPQINDEVYFACMRYFGRFFYEPAYPVLLEDLHEDKEKRWEFAAVAATVLRNYPGKKTVEALKGALHSSTWYVRANSAESLEFLGVSYAELAAVFEGHDRYAREILQYRMDYRKAKEREEILL